MSQVLTIFIIFAALCGAAYVLWRPQWAVLVVLVMFPLMQLLQAYSTVLNQNKTLMNLAVGFLALFALMSKLFKRETLTSGYGNPTTVLVFCLYMWAAITIIWSPSKEFAIDFMMTGFPYYVLMLIITPLLLTDLWDMRRIWIGIMVLGTAIAIAITVNPNAVFYGGRLTIDVGAYAGQEGGQLNALATAQLGGMLMIIAALVQFGRVGWLLYWVRAAAFISGFGLAILSGSRGQVIASAIAGVIFYPLARRVASPKQFFTVAAGLGVLMAGIYFMFRMFIGHDNITRWDMTLLIDGIYGRFESVSTLFAEFLSNPGFWVIGLGSNAYATLGRDGYVHNMLAEVLAEQGLIGFSILCILLYCTAAAGYRLWAAYRYEPVFRSVVAVLCAVSFYEFILSLKQGTFLAFPAVLFWFVILTKLSKHELTELAWAQQENQSAADAYETDEGWDDEQELAVAR